MISMLSFMLNETKGHAEEASAEEKFSLVVHPNLQLKELNTRELSMIFSGRRRAWSNTNQPIQLILLPSDSEEMKWLSKQLKMPEHLIRRFIFRRVYQGTMRKPIEVNTTEEALKLVETVPGSIVALKLSAKHVAQIDSSSESQPSVRLIEISQ